jgi:hypothetical protein
MLHKHSNLKTNIAAADVQKKTCNGSRNTHNKPYNHQQTKKSNQNHLHWKNPMQNAVKSENNRNLK